NRTYYIDYDKDAGGIAIRRLCSTSSDPGCTPGTGNAAHTRILAPGTTVPFPPTQVFTSGQTMISQTGKLQVTVDGVTETDATVHIRLTDQSGVTLSATSWDPPWQGGSTTVIVTNTGGQWGASSPVSWLTVSPRLGTSGTIATISAAANLTTTPRTSSVRFVSETIAQTFTVSQAGLSDDHGNTAATATPWPLASQASVTGTLEIAADVDVFAFTAPVSGTYTFVSNATGNVTGTLQDRVGSQIATNTNSGPGLNFLISRALTAGTEYRVAIRNSSSTTKNTGAYTITATVPQPASVSVTPSSWAAPQTGAKQTVTVTTNQSSWAASSSQSWLTLSPKSGKSGRVVTLTAAFNAQSTPREAVVTFTANGAVARVTVTQRGVTDDHGSTIATATPWDIVAAPRFTGSLEIGPDVDYFAFTAPVSGQYVFESAATGNVNGYLFNSAGSQIAYNLNSGPGSNFKITYALTAGQRYYLGLRNSSQRETNTNTGPYAVAITIPPPASLSVTMTDWTTPAAGAKQAITVTTNQTKWEGLSNASWISLSPRSGSSGRSVTLTAKRNTTGSARDAVVTFTANGATAVVRVHQPAQ
ncbi:MAG: BACON domain-containing protein, partial [Bifidobacteriaceae bacterium]|nr:BACON domain-containing protein [Bifidobacteriaceae bacterium]